MYDEGVYKEDEYDDVEIVDVTEEVLDVAEVKDALTSSEVAYFRDYEQALHRRKESRYCWYRLSARSCVYGWCKLERTYMFDDYEYEDIVDLTKEVNEIAEDSEASDVLLQSRIRKLMTEQFMKGNLVKLGENIYKPGPAYRASSN